MRKNKGNHYNVRVLTWGARAMFIRPEMEIDEVSYDIITPAAAKGVLESIYWTPGINWIVDKIYVVNPIKFAQETVIREGVEFSRIILLDVCYVIDAHFERTNKATKDDAAYYNIFMRRLKNKKPYRQPYFGFQEFEAKVSLCRVNPIETAYKGVKDLNYMHYDHDFSNPNNPKARFFRAVLHDGVLDLTNCRPYR